MTLECDEDSSGTKVNTWLGDHFQQCVSSRHLHHLDHTLLIPLRVVDRSAVRSNAQARSDTPLPFLESENQ